MIDTRLGQDPASSFARPAHLARTSVLVALCLGLVSPAPAADPHRVTWTDRRPVAPPCDPAGPGWFRTYGQDTRGDGRRYQGATVTLADSAAADQAALRRAREGLASVIRGAVQRVLYSYLEQWPRTLDRPSNKAFADSAASAVDRMVSEAALVWRRADCPQTDAAGSVQHRAFVVVGTDVDFMIDATWSALEPRLSMAVGTGGKSDAEVFRQALLDAFGVTAPGVHSAEVNAATSERAAPGAPARAAAQRPEPVNCRIVQSGSPDSVSPSLKRQLQWFPEALKADTSNQVTILPAEVKSYGVNIRQRGRGPEGWDAVVVLSAPPKTTLPAKGVLEVFVKDPRHVWVNCDKAWNDRYLDAALVTSIGAQADTIVIWLVLRSLPGNRFLEITVEGPPKPTARNELVMRAGAAGNDGKPGAWKTVPTQQGDSPLVFRVPLTSGLAPLPGPDSESCPWNNQERFIADFVSFAGDGQEPLASFREVELRQYEAEDARRHTFSRWVWRMELQPGEDRYSYSVPSHRREIHPAVKLSPPTFAFGPGTDLDVCAIPKGMESRTDRWEVLRTLALGPGCALDIDPFPPDRQNDALDIETYSGLGLRPQFKPCRDFAELQANLETDPVKIDVGAHLGETRIRVTSNIDGRGIPQAVAVARSSKEINDPLRADSLGLIRLSYWYNRAASSSECAFPLSDYEIRASGYHRIESPRQPGAEPSQTEQVLMQPDESVLRLKVAPERATTDRASLPRAVTMHFPAIECSNKEQLKAVNLNVRAGELVRAPQRSLVGGRPFWVNLSGRADSLFEIVSVAGVKRTGEERIEPPWPLSGSDSVTVVVRARRARAVLPYRIEGAPFPATPPEVTAWSSAAIGDSARRGVWPDRHPASGDLTFDDLDASARMLEVRAVAPPELDVIEQANIPVRFRRSGQEGDLVPVDQPWALVFEPRKVGTFILVEACGALAPAWDAVRGELENMLAEGGRPCRKLLIGLAQVDQRAATPATDARGALGEYRVSNLAVPRSGDNLKWAAAEVQKIDPRRPEKPCRLIYVIPSEPVMYKLWLGELPPYDPKLIELCVIEVGFPSSGAVKKVGVARSFVEANHGQYLFAVDPKEFADALRRFARTD